MGMPRKKPKNPPVMSHEFVIQNHADILACVAIVIVLGLVSEATAKISRLFIFLQYGIVKNATEGEKELNEYQASEYERGIFDIFTVMFAALMIAVVHAVIQEYFLDKISRKLHLSKTKNSKFNESGQIVVWCIVSAGWAIHQLIQSGFFQNLASLWEGYPHSIMKWENKLFLIAQIAYWVHMYPELYFQKARKEEVPARVQYYSLHLAFIAGAYILHFWRVSVILMAMHYMAEGVFHASRMLYYAEKNDIAKYGFKFWGIVFPVVRLFTLVLGFLMFWFGLGRAENQGIDFASGNYNSFFIRMTSLSSLCLLQAWLMWPFLQLQVRRRREEKLVKKKTAALSMTKPRQSKKSQKKSDDVGNGTHSGKLKKN
ncbi:translocating chain-associated membrane protein 1-like [Clavelina lepadiformis]|uniref:Translocating chain-associated membrane protein n=1 Tax=Clavelina lepadiformis TaxID=159417 RepID=A0ABP0FV11_CLALP